MLLKAVMWIYILKQAHRLKGLDFVGLLETLVNTLGKDVNLFDQSHLEEGSAIMQLIEKESLLIYERAKDVFENNKS